MIIKNYEGETKEFSELLDKLEKKHMCNRYYCYFCLKGSYDTLAENIKDNNAWLCPYCTGTCYCTRCMRNEKILQLIAYYFSINGDINYLHDELVSMNSIIDQLFSNSVMNNIYLIVYDKNLTPAQMINNFINYDSTKFNEIQSKEDEINNLKDYIELLNKQKHPGGNYMLATLVSILFKPIRAGIAIFMAVAALFGGIFGFEKADISHKKDGCLASFAVISDTHLTEANGRREVLEIGLEDISKAKELLGWQAELSLEDMCRDLWHWQSENPDGY